MLTPPILSRVQAWAWPAPVAPSIHACAVGLPLHPRGREKAQYVWQMPLLRKTPVLPARIRGAPAGKTGCRSADQTTKDLR